METVRLDMTDSQRMFALSQDLCNFKNFLDGILPGLFNSMAEYKEVMEKYMEHNAANLFLAYLSLPNDQKDIFGEIYGHLFGLDEELKRKVKKAGQGSTYTGEMVNQRIKPVSQSTIIKF